MKPRILHVIDHTEEGGAQVVIRQFIANLGNQFEFTVAVLGRSGRFSEAYQGLGATVLELGNGRGRWNPFPLFELIQAIRHGSYDLVHVHLLKSCILGIFAARYMGRKVILHDHISIDPCSIKFYFRCFLVRYAYLLFYEFALRICHLVIVLTPAARTTYLKIYDVGETRVAVVPNGVDLSSVPPGGDGARESICRELGLRLDTKLIIMVARLEPEKDWLTFLKVAEYVPELTQIDCAFLATGIGSQEELLRTYTAQHCLEKVYFLGYRDDVVDLMAAAHVFLLTSRFESFGNVVLEAMMVGCPIVATRSGGPESILTHGYNGLLSQVEDAERLASNVVQVLENHQLRHHLIQNARETVYRSYNIETSARRIAEIYKRIL
jgi:glycosyltransferase involved in cell wall biosynthesis